MFRRDSGARLRRGSRARFRSVRERIPERFRSEFPEIPERGSRFRSEVLERGSGARFRSEVPERFRSEVPKWPLEKVPERGQRGSGMVPEWFRIRSGSEAKFRRGSGEVLERGSGRVPEQGSDRFRKGFGVRFGARCRRGFPGAGTSCAPAPRKLFPSAGKK